MSSALAAMRLELVFIARVVSYYFVLSKAK